MTAIPPRERNARAVASLHPLMQPLASAMLEACERDGLAVLITDGYRSPEHQDRLYRMGRTAKSRVPCRHGLPVGECRWHPLGATVTNVTGGGSWHNCGRAMDLAFLHGERGVTWPPESDQRWERLGAIGEASGLEWGFRLWGWDRPHFMYRRDVKGLILPIAQAMAEWRDIRRDKR